MMRIKEGRYAANIYNDSGGFYVIVTRDGDCLPGIPGRHYANEKRALTGARNLIAKAMN